jgi:pimeloyl-ACP methyl ester carboxylesterase
MRMRTLPILAAAVLAGGCFKSIDGPTGDDGPGSVVDAIEYRDDLGAHPGCTTDGLSYPAAAIPGYTCAVKSYGGGDASTSIVLLVHGNSDTPAEWEEFEATGPMASERLKADGHPVYAIDLRIDKVDDPQANNDTENAARNIDHGWGVPLVQDLIAKLIAANPDRKLALVGFSLGVSIIRDALRRLHLAGEIEGGVWSHIDDVVLLAGANHGVSSFTKLCGKNPTMRGEVACEMGNRDAYAPTDFLAALNGPDGAWETPCGDGTSAYGEDACGGHTVAYTTIVMRDIDNGSYQDEFVSEASSALAGADNRLIELTDVDETGYFFGGLLKNHYGSSRSDAALDIVQEVLQ